MIRSLTDVAIILGAESSLAMPYNCYTVFAIGNRKGSLQHLFRLQGKEGGEVFSKKLLEAKEITHSFHIAEQK